MSYIKDKIATFTPVKYNDCYYVDGCVSGNLPFHLCNPLTTICLFFKPSNNFKLESHIDLIDCVIYLLANNTLKFLKNYKQLIIYNNDSDTQLSSDRENINRLIDIGYKSGKRFLIKEYKKQINTLTNKLLNQ